LEHVVGTNQMRVVKKFLEKMKQMEGEKWEGRINMAER
jgi:hypothetical protein